MDRNDPIAPPQSDHGARSRSAIALIVAVLVLGAGVLLWLVFGRETGPSEQALFQNQAHTASLAAAPPASAPAPEISPDGIPIMAAGSADTSKLGPRHPHPHTPIHERIYKENNLVGQMNGAMDVGDYAALRRMNQEYREEYPEDEHVLQEGYDLIADCLERRSPANRAAAEKFWDTQIASQLRRYVRRHCLD